MDFCSWSSEEKEEKCCGSLTVDPRFNSTLPFTLTATTAYITTPTGPTTTTLTGLIITGYIAVGPGSVPGNALYTFAKKSHLSTILCEEPALKSITIDEILGGNFMITSITATGLPTLSEGMILTIPTATTGASVSLTLTPTSPLTVFSRFSTDGCCDTKCLKENAILKDGLTDPKACNTIYVTGLGGGIIPTSSGDLFVCKKDVTLRVSLTSTPITPLSSVTFVLTNVALINAGSLIGGSGGVSSVFLLSAHAAKFKSKKDDC